MMVDLTDRMVLITGASSGIGSAVARVCARQGAVCHLLARDAQRLAAVAASLEEPSRHSTHRCDLNDDEATASTVASLPPLDGIVLCAGIQQTCVTKQLSRQAVNRIMTTNFVSAANLISQLQVGRKIAKRASIVIITSIAALYAPEPGNAAYSASKGALHAYARVLAKELARRQVRVNTIAPGIVRTPLLDSFDVSTEQWQQYESLYPLGFGQPDDVAHAAAFLLSDDARWVTGTELVIDGGFCLR